MSGAHAADVLLVSLGATAGLHRADDELQDSLTRAGARVAVARAFPPDQVRTLMLTDLVWARAARLAMRRLSEQQRAAPARAVIYSTSTAALLWKRPGAIRFDAPAAGNRPGRDGLWQRPLERRRLRQAPLLLPWSEGGLREAFPSGEAAERSLVLPVPIEPAGEPGEAGEPSEARDIAAVTYAANPAKKGLERVLAAWRGLIADGGGEGSAGAPGELVIAGVSAQELQRAGLISPGEPGVCVAGALVPADFRALLRRARVFVCAPRREDYGLSQLEALADGCQLVTSAAPGPYVALPIARALDSRLVGEDLTTGLRAALTEPRPDYAERARVALAPYTRESVDRLVAEQLLPRLLA